MSARLLKPSDVAERLGVSRTWLYAAARTGRIPSIRLGDDNGPLRFIEADVDDWLERTRAAWVPGRAPAALQVDPPADP
jgi:excisionase family DNA binding protein